MRKAKLSEPQIVAMLKEQEAGVPTADLCRKYAISPASFYKYKAKFGGLDVSDARKLKVHEHPVTALAVTPQLFLHRRCILNYRIRKMLWRELLLVNCIKQCTNSPHQIFRKILRSGQIQASG